MTTEKLSPAEIKDLETQLDYMCKGAMVLAHELHKHTEQYAEGYISSLRWRTLESKRKAESLERRIKMADDKADEIRAKLGISDD